MGLTKSLYADLSCEEVFELERHCDELREADIAAQDAAMEAEAAAQAEAGTRGSRARSRRGRGLLVQVFRVVLPVLWQGINRANPHHSR